MPIDRNLHNFVYPDRGFSPSADCRRLLEDENDFFLEDGSVTPSDLHKEKRFPRIKVANLNVLYNFHSIDLSEIISRGAHIQTRIPTVSNFRVISRNHFVEISVFCALKNRVIA